MVEARRRLRGSGGCEGVLQQWTLQPHCLQLLTQQGEHSLCMFAIALPCSLGPLDPPCSPPLNRIPSALPVPASTVHFPRSPA